MEEKGKVEDREKVKARVKAKETNNWDDEHFRMTMMIEVMMKPLKGKDQHFFARPVIRVSTT